MSRRRVFTREERDRLMAAYVQTKSSLADIERKLDAAPAADDEYRRLTELTRRLSDIIDLYEQTLPRMPMGRCPVTGQQVDHSFDPFGFDGLWWHYDHPVRPDHEDSAGPHFLGITGAVRLAAEIEATPFAVEPGPEVPFVVPRVLCQQGVLAVISLVNIGAHHGAAIAYFAPGGGPGLPGFPQWGVPFDTLDILARTPGEMPLASVADYDYELAPWVETGKLLWIAPGDAALNLHRGISGCPYLHISGQRKVQRLSGGRTTKAMTVRPSEPKPLFPPDST